MSIYTLPLLMKGPLVRATLDGRKTETRRFPTPAILKAMRHLEQGGEVLAWIKETWQAHNDPDLWMCVRYRAGGIMKPNIKDESAGFVFEQQCAAMEFGGDPEKWRTSLHMPKTHSRLTLQVSSIRLERLHQITEHGAQCEGLERLKSGRGWYDPTTSKGAVHFGQYCGSAREAFIKLWDHIHGAGSWDENPELAVITYTPINQNILEVLSARGLD